MSKTLVDKVAIVTGAASGIGRAAALAYARNGATVVVADIDDDGNEETAESAREIGVDALAVKVDVSNAEDVEALVERAIERFGRLDCAFNNAGIGGAMSPTADYTVEQWDRVIAVNLRGVWLCMRAEIQRMLGKGSGVIVNMASILGKVGFAGAPAYTAAKHGVVGLTKAAALEYSDKGIRINVVCPAFITTPMLEDAGITSDPETRKRITDLHPIGRMGTSEEVAEAVVWLSSPASSFVTGHAMLIDGGYTAR